MPGPRLAATPVRPRDLGLLFRDITDAVVVFEVATERVALLNPAAQRLLGARAAEAIGQPIWSCVPRAGQPQRVATAEDGAERWIDVSVSGIDGAHAGHHFAAAVCRDVTEQVHHERLQGALLAARTAQHALNDQLTTAMGYAELLAENPLLTGAPRDMVQGILAAVQEAAATVARLGRITRLEEVDRGGPAPVLDLTRSVEPLSGE